jgi:hypothetical protein
MGCSSSRVKQESAVPTVWRQGKKRQTLEDAKKKYHTNHENLELLMLDGEMRNDFFKDKEGVEFIRFFEQFYGKYKIRFDKYNITYEETRDVILEKIVESEIRDELNFKTWECENRLFNIIEDQKNMTAEKEENAKIFLKSYSRLFSSKQKGCVLDTGRDYKWGIKHFLTNLKFNASFEMEFLLIFLNLNNLTEDLIIDICEVIESNTNLSSIGIILTLSQDGNSQIQIENLNLINFIIKAIFLHKEIKHFLFANYSEYNIILSTITSLSDLIIQDRLHSLLLSKVNLGDNLGTIINIIGSLSNLKFFLFDCRIGHLVLNSIRQILVKSKKLSSCVLSGLGNFVLEDGINLLSENVGTEIKMYNTNLVYFEVLEHLNIFDN